MSKKTNTHKHESAFYHTSGEAQYIDDQQASLITVVLLAQVARATSLQINTQKSQEVEGVHAVITSADIPGDRFVGPIIHDEPLLAHEEILYHGQALALVVAETYEQARAACDRIEVSFVEQKSILTIQDAIDAQSFHNQPHRIARGLSMSELQVETVVSGLCQSPAQDHFYLETQAAIAKPIEGGCYEILSSTQHPTEVQKMAARVLGIAANRVVCSVPRMGGGFGGKESQATQIGAFAALGAWILWLGWFGFNGGSVLKLGDAASANAVAVVFLNTNTAAAGGAIAALLTSKIMFGKADLTMVLNGALAGLVAITAEPSTPTPLLATIFGAVGGVLVVLSIIFLDKIKIDDPVGAISVHGTCGLLGLLLVPLTNDGVSFSGQLIGAATIFIWVFGASFVVWTILKMVMGIRVSEEEEAQGQDSKGKQP